jgi:hypothetical protein
MYCEDSGNLKLRELRRLVWEAAAATSNPAIGLPLPYPRENV